MIQPKFNFGDKVFSPSKKWGPFVVTGMYLSDSGEWYAGDTEDYEKESALEFYKEPQKKKLYAYRYEGEVKFLVDDSRSMLAYRAPEYDIEYP